ncbi:AGAP001174-PA-like protein [Anopheles sinensis]|uniref:AGAP001174-PA-like protein n=1 Tax=Anopheles sinensis TaxID=74873 RepID=A0A084WG24_ANOSI|nr:AGAP001174-PA-like protein [Anopheles sinensis]
MRLIILCLCILLSSLHAAQALRCMHSKLEIVNGYENKKTEIKQQLRDCSYLLLPSKCYHMRKTEIKNDLIVTTTVKGCFLKSLALCDGSDGFCSECYEDECNSAIRFVAGWKILYLTILALVYLFMNYN